MKRGYCNVEFAMFALIIVFGILSIYNVVENNVGLFNYVNSSQVEENSLINKTVVVKYSGNHKVLNYMTFYERG
jgi:hypothetical protein